MFKIILALLFSSVTLNAEGRKEDPKWRYCDNDADCIVINGICSRATPINRKFKKEADEYYFLRGTADSCESSKKSKANPTSQCRDQLCVLNSAAE